MENRSQLRVPEFPEWETYLNWDITQAAVYSHDCVGCAADTPVVANLTAVGQTLTNASERIALSRPGTRYADRLNLGVSKYTGVAGQATSAYSIAPFVLNGPGGRPTSVLQARLLRLAVQFHF